jgi:hypothetical protein
VHIPRWSHALATVVLASGLQLQAGANPPGTEPAYRGGALLVTDPGIAQGHLAPGLVLPIRLSRLTPAGPGLPSLQGTERPGSVRYGQLTFLAVSPNRIRFTVAFMEAGAGLGPARTISLGKGESVDLTGDGLPDLVLKAPAQALTAGGSAVDYALLAFPCDAAHAAMFALSPGVFAQGRYPYGISGVTPKGHFVFQSDCLTLTPAGAAGFTATELAVRPGPGDVLVDAGSGRFGPIAQVRRTRKGLDIQVAGATTPFQFQEVFGAACIDLSGNLAELRRRFRCGPGSLWDGGLDLVDIAITQPLLDGSYGRLDLQVAARLSVSLDLSATINFYGMSAALAAYLDESVRLAAAYRADQPHSDKFGPYSLAKPEVGFAVCGVPLAFVLELSAGLDLDDQDTGTALQGVSSTGRWGWSGAFAATWGWLGVQVNAPAPVVTDTLVIQGLPENRARMHGQATFRPWLAITPKLKFAGALCAESPNTLAFTGSVRSAVTAGQQTAHAQEDVSYELAAGFCLDLPLLGKVWERTWPLYTWSDTVWSRDWVIPSAAIAP